MALTFFGEQKKTPSKVIFAETQQSAERNDTPSIYTNYLKFFDDDPNTDGTQLNYQKLADKKYLRDINNRMRIAGGPGFNEKDFRKFGESALNYQKYYNIDTDELLEGVDTGKALKAKEEYERYRAGAGKYAQSLRQKRYGVDENGNPIEYWEGEKGFGEDGKNYNTAEEATAAYQKQQQDNKDARAWAGKNYMEDEDYWNGITGYQGISDNHADNIKTLARIAGITDEALIEKAIKGGNWGSKSNEIFQKAVDKLAQTNYKEAKKLYNTINGMYYGKDHKGNVFKNTTLYDGAGAFTDTNKRNWLESQAGVNDVDDFYNKYTVKGENKAGYNDDYQRYVEKQKEKAEWERQNSGYGTYYGTQFKQGGKMNKYQQGGQAPTAAQMVLQALSAAQQGDQSGLQQLFSDKKTAQAVIQQLQKEAQEGSEEAMQALEALKQLMGGSKKQAAIAQKGAKLSYIHRLATGCPPGMEMTYFKKGGRLCKACVEKAKKAKEGASIDSIIAKNKRKYPGITNDQAAGRAPIRKNNKDYYLGGDGKLYEAPKKGKYGSGGFLEYFKCGGKPKKPKCGTKAKCGAELEKCGGKTPMDKCGGKTPMTKCGGKAPMDKCGGKTTLAKCGTELKKCGGKAKKSSSKKCTVKRNMCGGKAESSAVSKNMCGGKAKSTAVKKNMCGGKAKKHAIGGNLELLKYMILNYNK